MSEAALQARADELRFGRIGKHGVESGINVPIRHTASAKLACDAEASLATATGALAGEVERVAGVVEIIVLAQAGDDLRDMFFILSPAFQIGAHFVDGMSPTHECAEGGGVKLLLSGQLPGIGSRAHQRSIVG